MFSDRRELDADSPAMREVETPLRGKLLPRQVSKQTGLGFFPLKFPEDAWEGGMEKRTCCVPSFGDKTVSANSKESRQGPSTLGWLKYKKAPVLPASCEAIVTGFFTSKMIGSWLIHCSGFSIYDFTRPAIALLAFPRRNHPWLHFSLTVSFSHILFSSLELPRRPPTPTTHTHQPSLSQPPPRKKA